MAWESVISMSTGTLYPYNYDWENYNYKLKNTNPITNSSSQIHYITDAVLGSSKLLTFIKGLEEYALNGFPSDAVKPFTIFADTPYIVLLREPKNAAPTLTLNTSDNRTLYENDTFLIDGQATDADNGNIVNVKYSINGGTARAIATAISNGSAPIPYSKSLTFKGGKLYDGESLITEALGEGTAHTLKVWAEDDKGGKSAEQVRSFYVVPNRPATLTINPVEQKSGLINNDSITMTGSVNDPESQNVIVKYKIGGGEFIEIYNGPSGAFSFDLKLADLAAGANQITLQAIDSYNFITSKALTVTKAANNTALLDSNVRYSVVPPKGTAQGIIVWVQREVGDLTVSANVSMRMNGEQESFQAMTLSNTAPVADGIVEDEFTFDAGSAKEQIVIELNLHRADPTSTAAVKLISGVLN
ncbi:hypothetical protein [Cytobacillus massiliigabonensis]|uniref:hypothetical protein n=1 Tax=Cytobacillus massiliigabonensis TaxID=1871011 RepID=UPI000C83A97D|nr:hypothetical protein [Cytobacillus massiliigabonensis]